jgi:hypothetical protein
MRRMAAALAMLAVAALANAQPQPPTGKSDRPLEFSCPSSQPLDFTRAELEQKASEEVERRGGKMPARYHTSLKRWGCDWWVFVLQEPAVPGADFGVLVDGISGAVKQFVRR